MKLSIRRTAATLAIAVLPLMGCQDLLDVEIEGQITDELVNSATAAHGLRLGALSSFLLVNGSSVQTTGTVVGHLINTGLLADEVVNRAVAAPAAQIDQRTGVGANEYVLIQKTRAQAFQAIDAIQQFLPPTAFEASHRFQGELYFYIGYLAMQLGENFCNGVPLSRRIGSEIIYGQPLTGTQMYDSAIAYYNTALGLVTDTVADTASKTLRYAIRVAKARAFNNRGLTNDPDSVLAILGGVNPVPTSTRWALTFGGDETTSQNTFWAFMWKDTRSRASIGDSINPDGSTLANSLPFASAGDPRVPVFGTSQSPSPAGNGLLPLPQVRPNLYLTATTAINLVSGVDARLLEAEAQLKKGNTGTGAGQMTAILNTLRGTTVALTSDYTYTANALPALAAPANVTDAVKLMFREAAFWTYGRGQRLGSMRRLIRQWGPAIPNRPPPIQSLTANCPGVVATTSLTSSPPGRNPGAHCFVEETVFPIGPLFDQGGSPGVSVNEYAHEINFTISGENANPNMPSPDNTPDDLGRSPGLCTDREA